MLHDVVKMSLVFIRSSQALKDFNNTDAKLTCLTLLARDRLVSAGSDFLHVAQRARFLLNQ